jgi:Uma2 family endonuclease
MIVQRRATVDDLYGIEGKAELIGGRIVRYMASGYLASRVSSRIYLKLEEFAQANSGVAAPDGLGYEIPEISSGRESFEPDASSYAGPLPANRQRFIAGPPAFAVEVRSENDYGAAADADYVAKRADYFEAGTLTVWDVDPVARTVARYTADASTTPTVFRDGDTADAEPAVRNWRVDVSWLFG